MRKIIGLLLVALFYISLTACGGDGQNGNQGPSAIESTQTGNENGNTTTPGNSTTTNPPATLPSDPIDNDVTIKASLIEKYGSSFIFKRHEGMAMWRFTFSETSAERVYQHSMEGMFFQKSLSWKIENGELVITGDWNETFTLNIETSVAISKTDGKEYSIYPEDTSLTMYGILSDAVLTYGFPIEFRIDKESEQTIIRLYEGYAEHECKKNGETHKNDNVAWSIDDRRLRVFGDFEASFVIDIENGTATSQSNEEKYKIFVKKEGELQPLL